MQFLIVIKTNILDIAKFVYILDTIIFIKINKLNIKNFFI